MAGSACSASTKSISGPMFEMEKPKCKGPWYHFFFDTILDTIFVLVFWLESKPSIYKSASSTTDIYI